MSWLSASNLVGAYSVLIGLAMIGMWTVLLATNQVPELQAERRRATLHLAAEFLTAILLIISGAGLLLGSEWTRTLSPVSLGMLLYTVIVSAGYYANKDVLSMVTMFIVLTILTVVAIIALFKFT